MPTFPAPPDMSFGGNNNTNGNSIVHRGSMSRMQGGPAPDPSMWDLSQGMNFGELINFNI